jgi:hypothetical protein
MVQIPCYFPAVPYTRVLPESKSLLLYSSVFYIMLQKILKSLLWYLTSCHKCLGLVLLNKKEEEGIRIGNPAFSNSMDPDPDAQNFHILIKDCSSMQTGQLCAPHPAQDCFASPLKIIWKESIILKDHRGLRFCRQFNEKKRTIVGLTDFQCQHVEYWIFLGTPESKSKEKCGRQKYFPGVEI